MAGHSAAGNNPLPQFPLLGVVNACKGYKKGYNPFLYYFLAFPSPGSHTHIL